MTAKLSNEFIIQDFSSVLNGVLKSSKAKPLIKKRGIKLWHAGKGTKLIKVQNNKIFFTSIFKFLESRLGNKKIEFMISANLDENQEKVQFSYQAKNIKNFPNWLEDILKTNRVANHTIDIPQRILFFRNSDYPFELRIKMKTENALAISLVIPLNTEKLFVLRERP